MSVRLRPIETALAAALVVALSAVSLSTAETPNIIVILADDLGYGDVGCYGAASNVLHTPNIDRLAAEGLKFTDGHCSNSTCTPTRYAMLTGQYAFRESGTGIGGINSTLIIDHNRTTIADLFKSAGYATAVVGKWHLGLGAGGAPDWNGVLSPGPLDLGFDYAFLMPNTNDRVPSVYVENHAVLNLDPGDPLTVSGSNPDGQPTGQSHRHTLRMDWSKGHNDTIHNGISRIGFMSGGVAARWRDEDMADDFVDRACDWIETNKNGPFFLYFASHDCHVPRMPHERFQGESALGWRGDAIVQLDWCVGALIEKLEDLDLTNNTMVVFCSDNGPVLDDGYKDDAVASNGTHAASGVYSGGKYSVHEGGTRTPFITWWPGRIPAGEVSDRLVCSVDFATSFAALTGQTVSEEAFPDSFNILDALLGVAGAQGRDHLIQSNNTGNKLGMRQGDWKLFEKKNLYDLDSDPGEQTNLAGTNPDQFSTMTNLLETLIANGRTAPLELAATPYDGMVHLDWPDDVAANFASFSVCRSTVPGNCTSAVATAIAESTYTDTNVTNNTTYYYKVTKLADSGVETEYSTEEAATPQPGLVDSAPPSPDPAAFDSFPAFDGTAAIVMSAQAGADLHGPVEYRFVEISGNPGGSNSGWQTSLTYTNTGLQAGMLYGYRVQMRDALHNAGAMSSPTGASTSFSAEEAEDAFINGGTAKAIGANWSGTGFVDLDEGGFVEFNPEVAESGFYTLDFRTAGAAGGLAAAIEVNGGVVNSNLACPNTGSWNAQWEVVTQPDVVLNAGSNSVRFTDAGSNQPQLDQLVVRGNQGYAPWARQRALLEGPDGDDDNDGLSNLGEYAACGNPTNREDVGYGLSLEVKEEAGQRKILCTYPRRADSNAGLLYQLEQSTNLLPQVWVPAVAELSETNQNGFATDCDAVTNRFSLNTNECGFFRLRVTSYGD